MNLNIQADKNFLIEWQEAILSKIREFNVKELVDSIYIFEFSGIQCFDEFLYEWQENAKSKINEFSSQDLKNILYSFSELNIHLSEEFIFKLQQAALCRIDEFKSGDLVKLIYLFAKLDTHTFKKILTRLYEITLYKIQDLKAEELVNLSYIFLKYNINITEGILKNWEDQLLDKVQDFSRNEFVDLIYGFGKLSIKPSNKLLEIWQEMNLSKFHKFNAYALNHLIHGFARLCVPLSDEFLKSFNEIILHSKDEFSNSNLITITYSLVLLNQEVDNLLIEEINNRDYDNYTKEDLQQIWYIYKSGYKIDIKITSYIDKIFNNKTIAKTKSSALHKKVSRALNVLGIKHENEYYVDAIKSYVDIYIDKYKLIIQVDGPCHYIKQTGNSFILNTSTNLNNVLLTNAGFNIIRISYLEINKCNEFSYICGILNAKISQVKSAFIKSCNAKENEKSQNNLNKQTVDTLASKAQEKSKTSQSNYNYWEQRINKRPSVNYEKLVSNKNIEASLLTIAPKGFCKNS